MEQVLHLFITNKCRHQCEFCCNKLYKISEIPVVTVELLKSVDTVCLTGGEPFGIGVGNLYTFIKLLRNQYPNIKNLYIYTSGAELALNYRSYIPILGEYINGINVAPKDVIDWMRFVDIVNKGIFKEGNSNRLYVFKEQRPLFDAMNIDLSKVNIQVIDRQWTKSFNTSDNEYFARLPILFD